LRLLIVSAAVDDAVDLRDVPPPLAAVGRIDQTEQGTDAAHREWYAGNAKTPRVAKMHDASLPRTPGAPVATPAIRILQRGRQSTSG